MARNPMRPPGDDLALYRQEVERRLRALETRAPGGISGDGVNSYLQSGDLILSDDGAFRVQLADGTTLMVLDDGRLRFNRANGTRQLEITPAGGMKLYAANGSTVRSTLDGDGVEVGPTVLNASGLFIGGVQQPAIETLRGEDASNNDSLTSSFTTVGEVVLTIPSFATVVDILSVAWLQVQSGSGDPQWNIRNRVINDVGGVDGTSTAAQSSPANTSFTDNVAVQRSDRVTSPGSTITVRQQAAIATGSSSTNQSRLSVFAVARRVA